MSRIRSLKPSYFKSRSLAKVSRDARTTFQGLWCEADDAGRGIADARILKGAVWSLDDAITHEVVETHLRELAETNHIVLYEVDGDRFYAVNRWALHQSPALRRGEGKYPLPEEGKPWSPPDSCTTHDQSCKEVLEGSSGVVEVEGIGPSPSARNKRSPSGFDAFWAQYPRRVAKADAERAWAKAVKAGATVSQVLDSLLGWCLLWSAEQRDVGMVPYPATWLNRCDWREVPEAQDPPKATKERAHLDVIDRAVSAVTGDIPVSQRGSHLRLAQPGEAS